MTITKEVKEKIFNKMVVFTGVRNKGELFKKYKVSNPTRISTTKQLKKAIDKIYIEYAKGYIPPIEIAKNAKRNKNIEKIKKDNLRLQAKIKELEQKIKELEEEKSPRNRC